MRQVVEPLLSGGEARHHARDLEYVRDLGLLAPDSPPRMANPIYAEVVPRGAWATSCRTVWIYRRRGTWMTTAGWT